MRDLSAGSFDDDENDAGEVSWIWSLMVLSHFFCSSSRTSCQTVYSLSVLSTFFLCMHAGSKCRIFDRFMLITMMMRMMLMIVMMLMMEMLMMMLMMMMMMMMK